MDNRSLPYSLPCDKTTHLRHTLKRATSIMEIFMTNVPYSVEKVELQRYLEPVLHGESFKQFFYDAPFNFLVRLFKNNKPRGQTHSGKGVLVVPLASIGVHFLNFVSLRPFYIHDRRVNFTKSIHKAKASDLLFLETPYQDIAVAEEKAKLQVELAKTIKIKKIQFGWPCRDKVISIEWQSPVEMTWNAEFDAKNHRLILKSSSQLQVTIIIKSIQHLISDSDSCILVLERPPIFERGRQSSTDPTTNATSSEQSEGSQNIDGLDQKFLSMILTAYMNKQDMEMRDRVTGLESTDNRIFAYLRVIRLKFSGFESRRDFQERAKRLGLHSFGNDQKLKGLSLFSHRILDAFNIWLASLSFGLAFQIEGLLSRRLFHPNELYQLNRRLDRAVRKYGENDVHSCIRALEQDLEECEEQGKTVTALQLFEDRCRALENNIRAPELGKSRLPREDVFHSYRVMVTPTSIIPSGPLADETNRVIREYIGYSTNFIRVEFREEDRLHFRWEKGVDGDAFIDKRIGSILKNGLHVAGRKFDFLAYSSSALREHAVWFVTPFIIGSPRGDTHVTAQSIRESLGDFSRDAHCPARYGARLSQAFTATEPSVSIAAEEIFMIEDIKDARGDPYTDGVGTISPELADEIWEIYTRRRSKHGRRHLPTPSVYQIRLAGYKGVLCVDSTLEGRCICVRPSMDKFTAPTHNMVEIARAFDRPMSMFLNRPLIMLLETLGIGLEPFMDLLDDAVQNTEEAVRSLDSAGNLLEKHGLGTAFHMASVLTRLHNLGIDLNDQDNMSKFLQRVLRFSAHVVLRDLKYHARIPVPDAWTLVGVADEYQYLEEGEVYACVLDIDGYEEYIEGPILISRSPTVHPGDARMVYAIGEPPDDAPIGLKSLKNCVVFSCKGKRLPFMLAGGDLDGDIYCLIKDTRLHPPKQYPPGDYDPPERMYIKGEATFDDVANFVVNYIKNDILGVIATRILLIADLKEDCMADTDCIKLAKLHSHAVDFPKTGRPVSRRVLPKFDSDLHPDWYANELKEGDDDFYPSTRHIGYLFRAVQLPAVPEARNVARKQRRKYEKAERELEVDEVLAYDINQTLLSRLLKQWISDHAIDVDDTDGIELRKTIREMLDLHRRYSDELAYNCKIRSLSPSNPLTEEEVVAGTIVARSSQPRMRKDLTAEMRRETTELCAEIREAIEGEEGTADEDSVMRAWAAWRVSSALDDTFGARSFGLIALEIVFSALRKLL